MRPVRPGRPSPRRTSGRRSVAPFSITSRTAVADRLRSDFASTWMILIRPFTPPAALMSSTATSMPLLIASSKGARMPVRLFAVPITIGSPLASSVAVSDDRNRRSRTANAARHEHARSTRGRSHRHPTLVNAEGGSPPARNGQATSRPPVSPAGRKIGSRHHEARDRHRQVRASPRPRRARGRAHPRCAEELGKAEITIVPVMAPARSPSPRSSASRPSGR